MITLNLDHQLSGHVFPFLLVFVRFGAAIMLMPGLGESYVPAQVRLLFALLFSFLVYPVLMTSLPPQPVDGAALARLVAQEVVIGLFFGSVMQVLLITLETAGAVISVQLGLSNAMILNPTLATQSTLPSAFLGAAGVALIFMTGLDHLLLRGLVDTYNLFPAGKFPQISDLLQSYTHLVSQSFSVGVELAGPFLVAGLLLNVALGIMQRMMPQVQLFLVVMPVQIWGGLLLFAATVSLILTLWLHFFDDTFTDLLAR